MNKDDVIFLLFCAALVGPFLTYLVMSSHQSRKLSRLRSEHDDSALRPADPGPVRTDFGLSLRFGHWDESRLNKLEWRVRQLEYVDQWMRGVRSVDPEKYRRNPPEFHT